MANTIKPCPFCGSLATIRATRSTKRNRYYISIVCISCGARGKGYTAQTPGTAEWIDRSADALAAWNMRAANN